MLAHALSEQPLLFAMGMGGVDRPLPRMLRALGWAILETPFYFLVLNGKRFLRNIGPLRSQPERRVAADFLAFSGLGGLALKGIQRARTRSRFDQRYQAQPIKNFPTWTDRIWQESGPVFVQRRAHGGLLAVHLSATGSSLLRRAADRGRCAGRMGADARLPAPRPLVFRRDAGGRAGGWRGSAGGGPVARR